MKRIDDGTGLEDRTVRQHDPVLDPRRWRNGS
jgi:hypothetical protein